MKGKEKLQKQPKEKEEVESWVYILLLSALTILAWVLGKFDFTFGNTTFTLALFAYPFLYFIANIITKKYGVKETMIAIAYSAFMMLLFVTVSNLLTEQEIDYLPLTGELFGYLMSQLVNVAIYFYLYMNTLMNKFVLLLNYVFVLLINHFIAMLFASRMILLRSFWQSLIAMLLTEAIISIVLVFFDSKKIEPKVYKKLIQNKK